MKLIKYKGKDYPVLPSNAARVSFNKDTTEFTSDTVQGVLKETDTKLSEIDNSLDTKQEKTDNNLNTTSKTIVGSINELNNSLVASDNLKFRFATDGEGNYGYLGADDSFIPFKKGSGLGAIINGTTPENFLYNKTVHLSKDSVVKQTTTISNTGTFSFDPIEEKGTFVISATDGTIPASYSLSINADDIVDKVTKNVVLNGQYVTVNVTTSETSLYGQDVKLYNGSTLVNTYTFSGTGTCSFKLAVAGTFTIKSASGSDEATADITIMSTDLTNKATKNADLSFLALVPWSTGTDDEISAMIDAFYNNKITLSDIKSVWNVGDTRSVSLGAISTTYTGITDTHDAQTIELRILEFEHDDLATSINGHTKALLTIDQKDCLANYGKMNSNYKSYSYARYTTGPRRQWLQGAYEKALPSYIQSLIKGVTKTTTYPSNSSNANTLDTSTERCFLFSNWEMFGAAYSSYVTLQDGTQYEFYKTQSNRIKNVNGSAYYWWSRSGFYYSSGAIFVRVYTDGSASSSNSSSGNGLAPGFCL